MIFGGVSLTAPREFPPLPGTQYQLMPGRLVATLSIMTNKGFERIPEKKYIHSL